MPVSYGQYRLVPVAVCPRCAPRLCRDMTPELLLHVDPVLARDGGNYGVRSGFAPTRTHLKGPSM